MNTRKKKNIMIGILCSLLIFMTIGYAVLSQVLTISAGGKIKGNWDIYIESIVASDIHGDAKSLESKIGQDKLSASIEAELVAPGDYVDYKVTVRNNGTINAILTSANLLQKKVSEYIEITTTAQEDVELAVGNTMEFNIKIKFKDVENFNSSDETLYALTELQLSFVQVNNVNSDNDSAIDSNVVTDTGWVYEQIGGTDNYRITNYTGDFSTNTNSLTIVPGAITDQELATGDAIFENVQLGNFGIAQNDNNNGYQIVIPSSIEGHAITEIGSSVFSTIDMSSGTPVFDYNKFNITSVVIPEGITSINDGIIDEIYKGTFMGLLNLSSVTLPSTLTHIGTAAFLFSGFKNITLPSNLQTIGTFAFQWSKLTSINIPGSVTTIGEQAFSNPNNNGSIQTLTFSTPSSLQTIGESAFLGNLLTTVNIPSMSFTSMAAGAFEYNSIATVNFGTIESNVTLNSGWISNQLNGITPSINWGVVQ